MKGKTIFYSLLGIFVVIILIILFLIFRKHDANNPIDNSKIYVDNSTELVQALQNVKPGETIVLKSGVTFTGDKTVSGNNGAYFYSGVDGTVDKPITIESQDTKNLATLEGTDNTSGYVLYITGDYWVIKDLKIRNGNQGIMLDNSNDTLISNVEVYNIGQEGIHLRDGSSNVVVDNCIVHDTGQNKPGFGEGIYVGSDYKKWETYKKEADNNTIKNCTLGPNVAAEEIDIKEGTTGTVIENNTFNGIGISGVNYADSFIDVKGNQVIIRDNIGNQNNNSIIVDAIQIHQQQPGWGLDAKIYDNTFNLDTSNEYVVNAAANTNASVYNNTRSPEGNMYKGNIIVENK